MLFSLLLDPMVQLRLWLSPSPSLSLSHTHFFLRRRTDLLRFLFQMQIAKRFEKEYRFYRGPVGFAFHCKLCTQAIVTFMTNASLCTVCASA